MKKIKKLPDSAFEPMDEYEKELMEAIENDEFVEIPNQKEEIRKLREAAKYTLDQMKKDKRITIRVDKKDLEKIQNRAIEKGIRYQTIIASVLHQYANGKIKLAL